MYNSAIAAGYSRHTAKKANQKLEPKIDGLKDHLERAGITDSKIAELLNEALQANKVLFVIHFYHFFGQLFIALICP